MMEDRQKTFDKHVDDELQKFTKKAKELCKEHNHPYVGLFLRDTLIDLEKFVIESELAYDID